MESEMLSNNRSRLVIAVTTTCVAACIAACAGTRVERHGSLIAARQLIEGVYVLKEAHVGEETVLPPRVDGRFVLRNGTVVTILHYRLTEEDQSSTTSFGTYLLDGEHFSYRYDDPMVVTRSRGATTVSRTPPWDGMRKFRMTLENRTVRLQTDGAKQELLFTRDGLTYSENGRILRVWRRVDED